MKKRILSFVLAVVMLLGCLPMAASAESSEDKILSRLNQIRTNNYPEGSSNGCGYNGCWRFANAISQLLFKAGAPQGPNNYTFTGDLGQWYLVGSATTTAEVKKLLQDKARAGDIYQTRCSSLEKNSIPQHTGFIYSKDSTGFTIYGSAGAGITHKELKKWNNFASFGGTFDAPNQGLSLYRCKNNVSEISIGEGSETSKPPVTVTTGGSEEVTSSSALLRGTVTGSTKPSEVGMYLGTSESNMTFLGSDSTSGGSPWKFYYRTAGKRSLTPGTTYYYRAYAKLSSGTVWGDTKSFKTIPTTTVVTTGAAEEVTNTGALVRATVTGNTKPTKVGMYFGTSSNNMTELGSEGTSGGSPWKYYYRTAKQGKTLKEGTYYYYQAYAVVGGQTIWGAIKSFKTTGTTWYCLVHKKGNFLFYESAHPHKNYYTCAVCGEKFTDDTTAVVTSCSQCVNIKLNKTNLSMEAGNTEKLTATTAPAGQGVTWTSSDTTMAVVNGGDIIALRPGTVTVTAKMSYQSKEVTASCTVTITADETPEVYTQNVTDITKTSAILHGMAYSEYGTIDEAGMYFGTSRDSLSLLGSNRTNGESAVTLEYTVGKNGQPLTEGTTYYFQAYAKVSGKEYRGEVVPFTTSFGDSKFADVKVGQYYYDAVSWAVDNGVTSGTSATTFSPDTGCTRAQAVTFLWRAAGSPKASVPAGFADVGENAYYADAVAWAVEKQITNGISETKFAPDQKCTRAQIVTFQHRAAGEPTASSEGSFSDVPAAAYYRDAVNWAVENNITNGTGANTFSPDNICTRGQIVTFLYRAQ